MGGIGKTATNETSLGLLKDTGGTAANEVSPTGGSVLPCVAHCHVRVAGGRPRGMEFVGSTAHPQR